MTNRIVSVLAMVYVIAFSLLAAVRADGYLFAYDSWFVQNGAAIAASGLYGRLFRQSGEFLTQLMVAGAFSAIIAIELYTGNGEVLFALVCVSCFITAYMSSALAESRQLRVTLGDMIRLMCGGGIAIAIIVSLLLKNDFGVGVMLLCANAVAASGGMTQSVSLVSRGTIALLVIVSCVALSLFAGIEQVFFILTVTVSVHGGVQALIAVSNSVQTEARGSALCQK